MFWSQCQCKCSRYLIDFVLLVYFDCYGFDFSDYNTQAHSRVPQRWVQASSRELPLNGGTVEPRTISDKMNCLSHNGSYQYKSDTSSLTNGHCFSALDASESMSYASTTPLMQASNMSDSGQSQFTMMTHIQDSSGSDMSLRFEDTKHSPVTEGNVPHM